MEEEAGRGGRHANLSNPASHFKEEEEEEELEDEIGAAHSTNPLAISGSGIPRTNLFSRINESEPKRNA